MKKMSCLSVLLFMSIISILLLASDLVYCISPPSPPNGHAEALFIVDLSLCVGFHVMFTKTFSTKSYSTKSPHSILLILFSISIIIFKVLIHLNFILWETYIKEYICVFQMVTQLSRYHFHKVIHVQCTDLKCYFIS